MTYQDNSIAWLYRDDFAIWDSISYKYLQYITHITLLSWLFMTLLWLSMTFPTMTCLWHFHDFYILYDVINARFFLMESNKEESCSVEIIWFIWHAPPKLTHGSRLQPSSNKIDAFTSCSILFWAVLAPMTIMRERAQKSRGTEKSSINFKKCQMSNFRQLLYWRVDKLTT